MINNLSSIQLSKSVVLGGQEPSSNTVKSDLNEKHHSHIKYIRQFIHERKIDAFFFTDVNAHKDRTSYMALGGSIIGVLAPALVIASSRNKLLGKSNKLKDILSSPFNLNYNAGTLVALGSGGVLGGMLGGLFDKKEAGKLDKIDEGCYQLMNVVFPAILSVGFAKVCDKTKFLNNTFGKVMFSLLSMFAGAKLAVDCSNKLDDKYFDKYLKDEDRKLKKKDFLVNVDDFMSSMILAKVPYVDKIPMGKFLPFVYVWNGFQAGDRSIA